MLSHLVGRAAKATAILPMSEERLARWLESQSKARAAWIDNLSFKGTPGSFCLLPGDDGKLKAVLAGVDDTLGPWAYAWLPATLPPGTYRIEADLTPAQAGDAALGWALANYAFDRFKSVPARGTKRGAKRGAKLVWPKGANKGLVTATAEAIGLARDLINRPANDLGPAELAAAARGLARRHKAKVSVIAGDALLKRNYPTVHAVGKASSQAPRLIDLRWVGKRPATKVTLIGKGVCFDSGGLDLKTAAGMKLMKKDMGGAAQVLGLAHLIMAAKLPVTLRVLIPAVENAVAGNAFRPLDVIKTRKGLTVEVGNTDAEGRLILCDALAEADRESPDLIVDFATLTGAARVALGTELPALFCNDDGVAEALLAQGRARHDPLWRLPLHRPYRALLDSKVADLNNISEGGFGGAITAALFLAEFVRQDRPWVHIDLMAWNLAAKPGRPVGGEAMGLRAVYGLIEAMAKG